MCVSLFPMTCRSVWVCERHPWLNSSITVCGDPWEQTGPRACLAAFGRLIVVTQHCLRTGGAAGFNYGSVLRWETANFHSHISSLVTFSQCVLHVCSNWFEDFCSPQWFLFFLLRIFLPLVKPSLNISSLFFFFYLHLYDSIHFHSQIPPVVIPWLPFSCPVNFTPLPFAFYFALLFSSPLSLSSSHSAFPFIHSLFLLTVGPSSLWVKEANFHLITSLITVSHLRRHYSHNFSLDSERR